MLEKVCLFNEATYTCKLDCLRTCLILIQLTKLINGHLYGRILLRRSARVDFIGAKIPVFIDLQISFDYYLIYKQL